MKLQMWKSLARGNSTLGSNRSIVTLLGINSVRPFDGCGMVQGLVYFLVSTQVVYKLLILSGLY